MVRINLATVLIQYFSIIVNLDPLISFKFLNKKIVCFAAYFNMPKIKYNAN